MGNIKLDSICSRDVDFAQWYTDICKKAELMDYSSVKGFIIYRPYSYAMWEQIQKYLDNEFYIYKDFTLLIAFEPQENLCVGDVLVDELGHEFKIKAFEMFRFAGKVPDWASKISSMSITGQDYTIGNYIAKK